MHYVESKELSFRVSWLGLMKELERRGIDQVLLCRPGGNLESAARERGIRTLTWAPAVSSVPALNFRYPSVVKSISPDIVHTRLSSAAAMAGFWGRRLRPPVIAALEAMASGLPVIVSDIGGLREIAIDQNAGLTARVGDVSSFAGAMSQMLDMGDDAAARMTSNSLSRLSSFTNEAVAGRMIEVYERVLSRRRP
jgi:glycosyltransferase involved in cell wall biosynthesis